MAFQGLVAELPIGTDGLTGNKNQLLIRPTQLLTADDITYKSGTIRKEGGASKYNSTAISGAPDIIGGHDWFPSAGTQRVIVLGSDGKLYKDTIDDGTFGTTLKSGLTVTAVRPVFVEGGAEAAANDRKLFVFTEKNVVQVLAADGATTGDIATPPADWSGSNQPVFGLNHEYRIWGGGNANDPHRLYYSMPTDHEDFTGRGSGTVSVYPGEGERLIGAVSYKSLIIAWKFPTGIYLISTADSSTGNWRVARLSRTIGGVSPLGADLIDDDVAFIDPTGHVHLISAITEFGNLGTQSLSSQNDADMDEFVRRELNFDELDNARVLFYPAKRELHIGCAALNSAAQDRRLVVDFNRPGLPRFRFSRRDKPESLWLKQDGDGVPRLTMGDDAGFVWDLDQDSRSQDGSGYKAEFRTPNVDLHLLDQRLGTVRKNGRFLELVVEPKGNHNLNVDILWDDEVSETVTFNMGVDSSTLGSFVLGTHQLAGDERSLRLRQDDSRLKGILPNLVLTDLRQLLQCLPLAKTEQ